MKPARPIKVQDWLIGNGCGKVGDETRVGAQRPSSTGPACCATAELRIELRVLTSLLTPQNRSGAAHITGNPVSS